MRGLNPKRIEKFDGAMRPRRDNKSIFLPLIRMSPTALALVPKSPVDFYCFRIATEPVHGNLDTHTLCQF